MGHAVVWGAVVMSLLPALAPAAEPRAGVRLARLRLGPGGSRQRWALASWAREVRLRTSIEIAQEPAEVGPADPRLFAYPLLYLAGDHAFPRLSDRALARLREHLLTGGLLIIDDTGRAGVSEAFDRSVRRLLRRLFGRPTRRVPAGHVVYRSFYRLREPVGRRADLPHLEGMRVGRRYAVLYTRNDLLGAFMRRPHGGPARPVVPGGERQREQAYRLAVNLVMYALCLDYKDDHTHVMRLLQRRRGRAR